MSRPFRVLLVDDQIQSAGGFLTAPLLNHLIKLSGLGGQSSFEAFSSRDLLLNAVEPIAPSDAIWGQDFIWSLDVLILDLGGITIPKRYFLSQEDLPDASQSEIYELNTTFPGAAYYLKNREQLKSCQAVFILTQYDSKEIETLRHLNKHCHDDSVPWTVKHPMTKEGIDKVSAQIESLYADFSEGYTQLESRGAIEFAASHDEPVLIVGESGTGKEYIAKAVHRRWAQEKRKKGISIPDKPTVINCAGLSPELARSELFGHVRGSFTGADDHRIGAILEACGCKGIRSKRESVKYTELKDAEKEYEKLAQGVSQFDATRPEKDRLDFLQKELLPLLHELIIGRKYHESAFSFLSNLHRDLQRAAQGLDHVREFQGELVKKNTELLEESDGDIKFKMNRPFGTLFLDEFGDLPPEVQVLLLRFLESKELQPIGYPGRIEDANVRIIAATSDPRIARFVGETLLGGWRTESELRRPLREDLIFRIKGQVIRADSVTERNVENCLLDFITTTSDPKWDSEAIEYVVRAVQHQLSAIREAMENLDKATSKDELPAFGHRREIKRVVTLANAFVLGAQERGLRSIGDEVTREIVEKVWKPSVVVSFQARAVDDKEDGKTEQPKPQEKSEELKTRLQTIMRMNQDFWSDDAFMDGLLSLRKEFVRKLEEQGIKIQLGRDGRWNENGLITAYEALLRINQEETIAMVLSPLKDLTEIKNTVYEYKAPVRKELFGASDDAIRQRFKGIPEREEWNRMLKRESLR